MKWETIESAPKDGTRVLLVDTNHKILTGAWGIDEAVPAPGMYSRFEGWIVDAYRYGIAKETSYEFTHWMPLPPLPEEGRGHCPYCEKLARELAVSSCPKDDYGCMKYSCDQEQPTHICWLQWAWENGGAK